MSSIPRSSYEESCRFLQQQGYLDAGECPPLPDHLPQYDDPEPLGVSFFRTRVSNEVLLDNLTLPRTFIGRSEVNKSSFRNTDLTESNCAGATFSALISRARFWRQRTCGRRSSWTQES